MLEGIRSLLASEKAITGGVLVICATVLVGIGVMTVTDWQTYTRDIFITYASAKTVQSGIAMWTDAKKAPDVRIEAKTETKTEAKTEITDAS